MPIDEQKLRAILTEREENFKRHVGLLAEETDRKVEETQRKLEVAQEDTKRHVGVLVEETHRKLDLVLEGFEGLADKLDKLHEEIAGIRNEIEGIRLHLFRKADLERLEALEQRVASLEKRLL